MKVSKVPVAKTTYPMFVESLPTDVLEHGHYRVRYARDMENLDAILKLRFEVFNLEMGEGLDSSHETGRDQDAFDPMCHHLMVEDTKTDQLVGTYRIQTNEMAARNRGFYSAGEFVLDLLPEDVVSRSVEVGRACVAKRYRNRHVLFLLWKGLATYMSHNGLRYLFGCCSLSSQDPAEGLRALSQLSDTGHLHPDLRVSPRPGLECRVEEGRALDDREVEIPTLFRTYLRYGAKVCGPPAIDRDFKTIDFLVVLDVEALEPDLHRLFFDS